MSRTRAALLLALLPLAGLASPPAARADWPAIRLGADAFYQSPRSERGNVGAGLGVALEPAAGFGGQLTFDWTDSIASTITAGHLQSTVRLHGAAASSHGGTAAFIPITGVVVAKLPRLGRLRPYAGAGVTYPLVARSRLAPAVVAAGYPNLANPHHGDLTLDVGTDLLLAPRTTLRLDLRYLPVAETVVLATPRGDLFRKGIDTHPLTLTVGVAYRVFTPHTYREP
jgi:outer membrane protein W